MLLESVLGGSAIARIPTSSIFPSAVIATAIVLDPFLEKSFIERFTSESTVLSVTLHKSKIVINESPITYGRTDDDWLCIENAKTIEEAVDMLTIDAAVQLGINNNFGSIEKGKRADFVIFDENPFEAANLDAFKKIKSAMTIINGEVVYDANEDDISEWHSLLMPQEDEL